MTRPVQLAPSVLPSSRRGLDDPDTTVRRRDLISRKPFLQALYRSWHQRILQALPAIRPGRILELGSGAGFLKEALPDAITSDVLFLPPLDLIARGEALPFASGSLGGITMIDVFHHIPRPRAFWAEAARALRRGGVVAMIEPWRTPWSGWIYRYLHPEPFHPKAADWEFPSSGPVSGANGALPWIVFERDRRTFEREFPELQLTSLRLHTPFLYLLSGGFSAPALVPYSSFGFWQRLEARMEPRMRSWAMFALIVITRA
jgi:SAM-dependent methyltransferase